MTARTYRTLQALILGGTGLFLLGKIWSGTLYGYIHARFSILVLLAAIGLLILAQRIFVELRRNDPLSPYPENQPAPKERDRWTLVLVALPVLLGVLIPAGPHAFGAITPHGLPVALEASGVRTLPKVPRADRLLLDRSPQHGARPGTNRFSGEAVGEISLHCTQPELALDQFLPGRLSAPAYIWAGHLTLRQGIELPALQPSPIGPDLLSLHLN